jgi:hypothetical protein
MTFAVGDLFVVRQSVGRLDQDAYSIHAAMLVSPMIVKDDLGRVFIRKPDGRFLYEPSGNTMSRETAEALPMSHPDVVAVFGPEI